MHDSGGKVWEGIQEVKVVVLRKLSKLEEKGSLDSGLWARVWQFTAGS
jgi:hypothetical protein